MNQSFTLTAKNFSTNLINSTTMENLQIMTTQVVLNSLKYQTSTRSSASQTTLVSKSTPFKLISTQSQHQIRTTKRSFFSSSFSIGSNYNNLGSLRSTSSRSSNDLPHYSTTR